MTLSGKLARELPEKREDYNAESMASVAMRKQ